MIRTPTQPFRCRALAVVLILMAATLAPTLTAASATDGPCDDAFRMAGVGLVCRRAEGLYEVFSDAGESLGFTHGADPVPGAVATASATAEPPRCADPAYNTYYVHVIYARAHDDDDRYADTVAAIRNLVAEANGMLHASARATGADNPDLLVLCEGDTVVVENEVLPTDRAKADFSTIVQDLEAKGYDRRESKYWVFYDDTDACTCGGTGHIYMDDRASENNWNNGNGIPMFAVDFGYTGSQGVRIMLHEVSHTMGAVQDSAPHSTGAGHCWDGLDIMCYNDGGPDGDRYTRSACDEQVYDCGNDDYCHGAPASGTYLAKHWNVCAQINRFLAFGPDELEPVMVDLTCPASADHGDAVTCTFTASDEGDRVAYHVDWGDGTGARVPAVGHVAAGETQTATHAYDAVGVQRVRVYAVDDADPPRTSDALGTHVEVLGTPTLADVSCAAMGAVEAPLRCSLRATDPDSQGVRYLVDWGDGTVETIPGDGYADPGADVAASHAYPDAGTYNVTVTPEDDEGLTGDPVTVGVDVVVDDQPPEVTLLAPLRGHAYSGCDFRVRYAPDASPAQPIPVLVGDGCMKAHVTDDASGVKEVRVFVDGVRVATLDGRGNATYAAEFPVDRTATAAHLTLEAEDRVGRVTEIQVVAALVWLG